MFDHKNLITVNEVILRLCPEAKTIEQLFSDDEGQVQLLCRHLNCDRTAILMTQSNLTILRQAVPVCEEIAYNFSSYIDILEICEYPEDTAQEGE